MKNIFYITIVTFFSIGFLNFTSPPNNPSILDEKVDWMSWEEATKANEKNPKPFFIDLYTDWCGWCKTMDKSTFINKEVVKYLNENFYSVKLNAEQKEEIVWNGTTFKFIKRGRRGVHELATSLTGKDQISYPTFVYLNPEFQRIMISPGYKGPKDLQPELVFANEKKYLTMSWEAFKKEFKERKKKP